MKWIVYICTVLNSTAFVDGFGISLAYFVACEMCSLFVGNLA